MRPPRRRLSATQQLLALRSRYPGSDARLSPGRLSWTGTLQPTPSSVGYTVRVEYHEGGQPHVHVLDPPLTRLADDTIPHMYGPFELCLYYPDEFDPDREFIADTLVPWASEWLLHYELWLITGDWHGAGIHPGDEEIKGSCG